MADKTNSGFLKLVDELPVDRLKDEMRSGLVNLGEKAVESAGERITDLTGRLNDFADGGGVLGSAAKKGAKEAAEGGSPVKGALVGGLTGVKDKVKEKLGGGSSGGGEKGTKSTNIIEEIDIGLPVSVVYNQWTQFQEYSGFMKKVDSVEQQDETKVNFKAQVFWSHRSWEATILEQVPDERIVWRSKGQKGHVDGAVTFHELAPNLTRVLVVLEYYPQGLFERTGNLWRAQGRRARLELKHFRRHAMTQVIQEDPEEVEGWRGEISEGEVVRSHDEVVEEEQSQDDQNADEGDDDGAEDEYDEAEEPEAEAEEDDESEAEDEYEEPEAEEDEEAEDEYEEPEAEDEEYEEEPEEEPAPRSRRRRRAS